MGVEVRTVEEHESQSATTQDMQILRQLGAGLGDGREPKLINHAAGYSWMVATCTDDCFSCMDVH